MSPEDPVEFTVTPYWDSGDPAPDPGRSRPRPRLGRAALVPSVFWLAAAVLVVVGNFLEVYRLELGGTEPDGSELPHQSLAFDAWGRHHFTSALSDNADAGGLPSGARFGTLFAISAALFVIAAVWPLIGRWRNRFVGPAEFGLAGVFGLAGGVAAMVLSFEPERHVLADRTTSLERFHWGPCWPVEAAAAVFALLGFAWYRWQSGTEPVDPVAADGGTGSEPAGVPGDGWPDRQPPVPAGFGSPTGSSVDWAPPARDYDWYGELPSQGRDPQP